MGEYTAGGASAYNTGSVVKGPQSEIYKETPTATGAVQSPDVSTYTASTFPIADYTSPASELYNEVTHA